MTLYTVAFADFQAHFKSFNLQGARWHQVVYFIERTTG